MKLLVFNELATKLNKMRVGTIIAIVNPKPLKRDINHGYSFTIDVEQ
jgi:hypothetical protein